MNDVNILSRHEVMTSIKQYKNLLKLATVTVKHVFNGLQCRWMNDVNILSRHEVMTSEAVDCYYPTVSV